MSSPTPSGQPLDTESPTLSLLLCQAALRHSHFLLAVWSNKGMGRSAFDTMLGQTPFQSLSLTSPSESLFQRMSAITSIPRTLIAEAINSAHGPHIMNLLPRDQLQVLSLMAAMFSCLGFRRKEVYILREVLAVIMDMIVTSREEATAKAAKAIMSGEVAEGKSPAPQNPGLGIAGAGLENSSSLPKSATSLGAGTVGVRANVSDDGNESILRVVKYVCDIYGVDLSKIGISRPGSDPPEDDSKEDNNNAATSEEEDATGEAFGWPELQLGVVREAVAVAEALPGNPLNRKITVCFLIIGLVRLSRVGPIFSVNVAGYEPTSYPFRTVTPLHDIGTGFSYGEEERRPRGGRILGWQTCSELRNYSVRSRYE